MLVDYPILLVSEKERTVCQNYTRRRFEGSSGVQGEILKKTRSVVVGSYRKVDKQDRVTRIPVGSPRTICRKFLERGWNLVWIASEIESDRFKNSSDCIADICSHHITA